MGIWDYREDTVDEAVSIDEFEVEALDGTIGHVDEATFDVGASYVVVDTGPWIFGKKVLLPAGTIERVDIERRKMFVALTKEQIKGSPEYDPDDYRTEEYRVTVGTYYEPYLV